ncbi:MAG: SAM-dependent methyltransferase [Anaerolineae bacterium]
MEKKAAKTTWGPMVQIALEQLVSKEQRIVYDVVAYQLLPAILRGFVSVCRFDLVRRTLFNLADRKVPGVRGGILCRKRFIAETLITALNTGVQSVVILGAGFDTLAYRTTELESRQVYEVDLPQVIQMKKAELERLFGRVPAHVKLISLDFDSQDLEDALRQAGYSETEPIFFIWEGVTQYISETAVRKVFKFFEKVPAGSQLVFTYVRKDFIEGRQMYGLKVLYNRTVVKGRLWQFGLEPESIGAFLNQYSWKEVEQVGNAEYQERYLKPVNRHLLVMEVERAVHAERTAN